MVVDTPTHGRSGRCVEGPFSGDGKVAYAITGTNALLRIDTQTGDSVQLIGPSPSLNTSFTGGHAPGSAIVVDGTNLALPGIVTVADQAAPVMYASRKQIIFQIPWEAPVEPRPVIAVVPEVQIRKTALVLPGADPYFDAAFWFPVYAFDPVAVALGPSDPRFGSPIALHQDGGIVTPDSPAEPGEIVTLYATGFGPVSPAVPDGTSAPVDPPSIMTLPVQLLFMVTGSGSTPQRGVMTYAGLAPGYVGLYQINLQIPDGLDGLVPLVACAEDPCDARSYLGVLAISATGTQR